MLGNAARAPDGKKRDEEDVEERKRKRHS